jgi:hypothetical protein
VLHELARVEADLGALDRQRAALDEHRTRLQARLVRERTARTAPSPEPVRTAQPAWPPRAPEPPEETPEPAGPAARRTLSRHAVQNVLLLLGGALLAVAAVVFMVVSWGNLSVRAGILIGATALAVASAWPLARRGLDATGETIAFIGLALVPLDAIAVGNALHPHHQALHTATRHAVTSVGSAALWAGGLALLAIGWALYGRAAPLRLPRPTAVALAQLPFPLAAIAVGPTPTGLALALIATSGLDLALVAARRTARLLDDPVERAVAAVAGLVAAPAGVALAFAHALDPGTLGSAWRTSGVLVAAVPLALHAARRTPAHAWWRAVRGPLPAGLVGGIAAIGALAAPGIAWLGGRPVPRIPPATGAEVDAALLAQSLATLVLPAGAAVVAAGALLLPRRLRPGAMGAGVAVLVVLAVRALPHVGVAAFFPWSMVFEPEPVINGLSLGTTWRPPATWWYPGTPGMLLTWASVAVLAAAGATRRVSRRVTVAAVHPAMVRAVCRPAALAAGAVAGLFLAPAAALPYPYMIAAMTAVPAALGVAVARTRDPRLAGLASTLATYVAALTLIWARGERPAFIVVTAVLAVVCGAAAVRARTTVGQVCTGAGAVLATGLLATARWMTGGMDGPSYFAYLPLAVTVAALWITWPAARTVLAPGAVLRAKRPAQALAITASGLVVALLAAPQAVWDAFSFIPGGRLLVNPHPGRALAVALVLAALLTAVAAASATRMPRAIAWWRSTTVYGAYALALAALPVLGRAFPTALAGPYLWVAHSWAGAPESARAALSPGMAWAVEPLLVPVLAVGAVAVTVAAAAHRGRWAAYGVARAVAPVVLAPLPLAADVPYAVAVGFLVALTAALALWAAMARGPAGGATLWVGSLAAGWALAERPATFAVLGAFAVIGAVCAVRGRGTPAAATSAAVTALAVGAEGAAIALGGGLPRQYAALIVLGVAVLTTRAAVTLGAAAGRGTRVALGLVGAAAVLWLVAGGMAVGHEEFVLVGVVGGAAALSLGRLVPVGRRGLLVGAVVVVEACGVVPYGTALLNTAFGPYHLLATGWRGVPHGVGAALVNWGPALPTRLAMPVVAIAVGAVVVAVRAGGGARRAYAVASVLVPVGLTLLPYAAGLPYLAAPAVMGAVTAALVVQAGADRRSGLVPGVMALWAATVTVALAVVAAPALLITLGALAVLGVAAARYARTAAVRGGAAATAALACGGLAVAGPLAVRVPLAVTGFTVLVVAALAAFAAAEARHRRRGVDLPVEGAGYLIGVAGTALTCTDGRFAALGLAAAAIVACGTALRADRRVAALGAAALLAHLALWTWLARLHIRTPEAYTLTVTAGGLAAGWLARRRRPAASSWWAYGPALLVTFAPSLVAAWTGDGLVRPVLLAAAAFGVTIVGAVSRLQGPLLLGGGILLVNAGHELTPAIVDLVGNGPRWVPIAITGMALLFTGATYEHRLRDVRRAYRGIARMR